MKVLSIGTDSKIFDDVRAKKVMPFFSRIFYKKLGQELKVLQS
jgi:hypothetical protein